MQQRRGLKSPKPTGSTVKRRQRKSASRLRLTRPMKRKPSEVGLKPRRRTSARGRRPSMMPTGNMPKRPRGFGLRQSSRMHWRTWLGRSVRNRGISTERESRESERPMPLPSLPSGQISLRPEERKDSSGRSGWRSRRSQARS